jgi:hypothetical protein
MDLEKVGSNEIEPVEPEMIIDEEADEAMYAKHGQKIKAVAKKGKKIGQESFHYKCNYCSKLFIGPGSGTFLTHVRKSHPKRCPELFSSKSKPKSIPDFFSKAKMSLLPFDENIAVGVDHQE